MIRVIKRYESRKLYDTEESRYVSLEDISMWVREGQEIKVTDNATAEDVTPQILTQIILDEGKRGTSFLPTELLHELVRAGEKAFHTGVEQVQSKVDTFVQRSIDRLAPVRQAREEMATLRQQLGELESTLIKLETQTEKPATKTRAKASTTAKPAAKTPAKKTVRKAAAAGATKPVAKKTTVRKATAKPAAKTPAKKATTAKTTTKKATATKKAAPKKAAATKTTKKAAASAAVN